MKTAQQQFLDMNTCRFSTAGPLQSRKQDTGDPRIRPKIKTYIKTSGDATNVMIRPASRSVRQAGQTVLKQSSVEGTRLEGSKRKTKGTTIAEVIGQVELRLSKRST